MEWRATTNARAAFAMSMFEGWERARSIVAAIAKYVHLMAENKVLSFEPPSRLHQQRQPMQQQFDHPQHAVG